MSEIDRLSGRLRVMAEAAALLGPTLRRPSMGLEMGSLSAKLARLDATWEPIDWSEFD